MIEETVTSSPGCSSCSPVKYGDSTTYVCANPRVILNRVNPRGKEKNAKSSVSAKQDCLFTELHIEDDTDLCISEERPVQLGKKSSPRKTKRIVRKGKKLQANKSVPKAKLSLSTKQKVLSNQLCWNVLQPILDHAIDLNETDDFRSDCVPKLAAKQEYSEWRGRRNRDRGKTTASKVLDSGREGMGRDTSKDGASRKATCSDVEREATGTEMKREATGTEMKRETAEDDTERETTVTDMGRTTTEIDSSEEELDRFIKPFQAEEKVDTAESLSHKMCVICKCMIENTEHSNHLKTCLNQHYQRGSTKPTSAVSGSTTMSDEDLARTLQQKEEDKLREDALLLPVEELVLCQMCHKDLSHMISQRQVQHVNQCMDKMEAHQKQQETERKGLERERKAMDRAKNKVLDCPMCGKPLKTESSRKSHLNRCAKDCSVPREQMLRLLKQQREEYDLQLAAGVLPSTSRNKTNGRQTTASTGTPGTSKRNKNPTKAKLDEDTQFAMALSTSMVEEQQKQERQLLEQLETIDRLAMGNKAVTETKKGKRKKGSKSRGFIVEELPPLLEFSTEEIRKKIAEKVAMIVSPQDEEVIIEKTPPLTESKVSQKLKRLRAGKNYVNQERSGRKNNLWQRSSLSSNDDRGSSEKNLYYVNNLMSHIDVSKATAGNMLRRLSTIPGRRKSTDSTPDGQTPNEASAEEIVDIVSTQSAVILAELAAEGGYDDPASQGHSQSLPVSDNKISSFSASAESRCEKMDTHNTELIWNRAADRDSPRHCLPVTAENFDPSNLRSTKADLVLDAVTRAKSPTRLARSPVVVDSGGNPNCLFVLTSFQASGFCPEEDTENTDGHEQTTIVESLQSQLSNMVDSSLFSDVKLSCQGGKIVNGHRMMVAARCPHLTETLEQTGELDLKDFSCASVVFMLKFLYAGEIRFPTDLEEEVYHLAKRLRIAELVTVLESRGCGREGGLDSSSQTKAGKDNHLDDGDKDIEDLINSMFSEDSDSQSGAETEMREKLREEQEMDDLYDFMSTQREMKKFSDVDGEYLNGKNMDIIIETNEDDELMEIEEDLIEYRDDDCQGGETINEAKRAKTDDQGLCFRANKDNNSAVKCATDEEHENEFERVHAMLNGLIASPGVREDFKPDWIQNNPEFNMSQGDKVELPPLTTTSISHGKNNEHTQDEQNAGNPKCVENEGLDLMDLTGGSPEHKSPECNDVRKSYSPESMELRNGSLEVKEENMEELLLELSDDEDFPAEDGSHLQDKDLDISSENVERSKKSFEDPLPAGSTSFMLIPMYYKSDCDRREDLSRSPGGSASRPSRGDNSGGLEERKGEVVLDKSASYDGINVQKAAAETVYERLEVQEKLSEAENETLHTNDSWLIPDTPVKSMVTCSSKNSSVVEKSKLSTISGSKPGKTTVFGRHSGISTVRNSFEKGDNCSQTLLSGGNICDKHLRKNETAGLHHSKHSAVDISSTAPSFLCEFMSTPVNADEGCHSTRNKKGSKRSSLCLSPVSNSRKRMTFMTESSPAYSHKSSVEPVTHSRSDFSLENECTHCVSPRLQNSPVTESFSNTSGENVSQCLESGSDCELEIIGDNMKTNAESPKFVKRKNKNIDGNTRYARAVNSLSSTFINANRLESDLRCSDSFYTSPKFSRANVAKKLQSQPKKTDLIDMVDNQDKDGHFATEVQGHFRFPVHGHQKRAGISHIRANELPDLETIEDFDSGNVRLSDSAAVIDIGHAVRFQDNPHQKDNPGTMQETGGTQKSSFVSAASSLAKSRSKKYTFKKRPPQNRDLCNMPLESDEAILVIPAENTPLDEPQIISSLSPPREQISKNVQLSPTRALNQTITWEDNSHKRKPQEPLLMEPPFTPGQSPTRKHNSPSGPQIERRKRHSSTGGEDHALKLSPETANMEQPSTTSRRKIDDISLSPSSSPERVGDTGDDKEMTNPSLNLSVRGQGQDSEGDLPAYLDEVDVWEDFDDGGVQFDIGVNESIGEGDDGKAEDHSGEEDSNHGDKEGSPVRDEVRVVLQLSPPNMPEADLAGFDEHMADVGAMWDDEHVPIDDNMAVIREEEFSSKLDRQSENDEHIKQRADVAKTPNCPQPVGQKCKNKWVPPSPFTPMADYDNMKTPDLKKAIQKYGIKPVAKKRMINCLKDIYEHTHQYETDSEAEITIIEVETTAPSSSVPVGKLDVDVPEENAKQKVNPKKGKTKKKQPVESEETKKPTNKPTLLKKLQAKKVEKSVISGNARNKRLTEVTKSTEISEEEVYVNGSDSDEESSASDMVEESFMMEEEDIVCSQQESSPTLHQDLQKFFVTNSELYFKVLVYEPLEFDWLKAEVKKAGIKCSVAKLINYMDEKCITFTMKSRRAGKTRRRGRKSKKTSTVETAP